jgi:tetratricopeptide (TPR) repeat protein
MAVHLPGWPARRVRLLALLLTAVACRSEAPVPTEIDPSDPLVKRPRRPPPDPDNPIRRADRHPPEGREGTQLGAPELEAALARFTDARAAGNDAVAITELRACANKNPPSARCDGELGLALVVTEGRRAEAVYYLVEATKVDDPAASADLYRRLGDRLRALGQLEEAVTAFERVLAREDTADAHAALGHALQSLPGRLEDAAAELGKAWALAPEQHGLLFDQATVLGQIREPGPSGRAADLFSTWLALPATAQDPRRPAAELRVTELRALAQATPPGGRKKK